MGFDDDIEAGMPSIRQQYKKLINYVNNNRRFFRLYAICFVLTLVAIITKVTYMNMDQVMETASTITLDESSYIPFEVSEEIILKVPHKSSEELEIKTSLANMKLQITNIYALEHKIKKFLQKASHVCLHARHFGVPYDIIVFENVTMVNPEIVSVSTSYKNVEEQDLAGDVKWAKRPLTVTVSYLDGKLISHDSVTLYKHQASCFSHYNI